MSNWLTTEHPKYPGIAARETFTWDHYTGNCLDVARKAASEMVGPAGASVMQAAKRAIEDWLRTGDPSAPYLLRRSQGEGAAAYVERLMVARYPRHFSRIIGSIVGALSQVDSKAQYTWTNDAGEGLGDPDDEGAFMSRFWYNADGRGTNYPVLMNEARTNLLVSHELWYAVEPGEDLPRIVLFDRREVDNWLYEDRRLVETKIWAEVDNRATIREVPKPGTETEKQWTVYDLDGFERWRLNAKKTPEQIGAGAWEFPFYTDETKRVRRLPVGATRVPLAYHVGYEIAKSCNALWNLHSDVRNLIRSANHPQLRGKDVTTQGVTDTLEQRRKGQNVLLGDWAFISPDPENARAGLEMYRNEVREVYVESFQAFEDAAREQTATESGHEETRGRRSILSVVTDAMDEFENDVLFMLTQIVYPARPELWGTATVERSKDFKPLDPEKEADRIMHEIFPNGVEWPEEIEVELQKRVLDGYSVEVADVDGALREAAGLSATRRAQERAAREELNAALNGLPA